MLPRFKLPVVTEVFASDAPPAKAATYTRDTLTLGWEDRMKARARRRTDDGREFATALPRGTVLREGDLLIVDDIALAVFVVELDEPVFVVRPGSAEEWGLFCYFIGNSHQPMMIEGGEIVLPDVLGMRQVLEQFEIPFEQSERRFTPITGAADHRHGA